MWRKWTIDRKLSSLHTVVDTKSCENCFLDEPIVTQISSLSFLECRFWLRHGCMQSRLQFITQGSERWRQASLWEPVPSDFETPIALHDKTWTLTWSLCLTLEWGRLTVGSGGQDFVTESCWHTVNLAFRQVSLETRKTLGNKEEVSQNWSRELGMPFVVQKY